MTAAATTIERPARTAGMAATVLAVAGRTVKAFVRTPQLIVVSTVQGAMFLLIFRYVFGGAIASGGVRYVDFLVPGFVVTGVLFSGTGAAAGVAEDVEKGFVDRLRSLPIPRFGIVAGRALADVGLTTWGLVFTSAVGFAIGFRIHGGVPSAVAALGLCVVFGAAFAWVFITIGLVAGSAQAAQGMSLLVFPLTFVSSAYVPVETMPGWLQPVARNQPMTMMTGAVRGLVLGDDGHSVLGHSTGWFVVRALLWSAAIVAVFAPLAVARFRQASTGG
jgi:ABC transporter DrrB family efflux protein